MSAVLRRCVLAIGRSALVLALAVPASAEPTRLAGLRLADALDSLRARGLRLVYSDAVVRPEMTVATDPPETTPREVLAAVLAPHGLLAKPGPGGLLVVVRGTADPAAALSFEESIDVEDALEEGVGPKTLTFHPAQVDQVAGGWENVFRTLHTLPGVASPEELGSRLAVRGGGPDQNLVILDGVEVHNPYRLFGVTSVFNTDTLERVDFQTGAFEARHGDRLSSLLLVESRDGRFDRRLAGAVKLALTDASATLEGRLPGVERASWLVSGRRTYYDLVANRYVDGELPSFADVQLRLAWEPRPGRRFALWGLRGSERADVPSTGLEVEGDEEFRFVSRGDTSILALDCRLPLGGRTAARTVASFYRFSQRYDFEGYIQTSGRRSNAPRDGDSDYIDVLYDREVSTDDLALRQEVSYRPSPRQLLETGFELHRIDTGWGLRVAGDRANTLRAQTDLIFQQGLLGYALPDRLESRRADTRAGLFLQHRFEATSRLTLQGGFRIDHAWGQTTVSPRLAATVRLGEATRLRAAAGIHRQSPGYEKLFLADDFLDLTAASGLRSESAGHLILGVEHELGAGLLVRTEAFARRFSGLVVGRLETEAERMERLARYDFPPELAGEIPREAQVTSAPANAAGGDAYGFDVHLLRPAARGRRLSGWATYTWSVAEREAYGRRFPFDYDQRHAASLVANLRLADWLEIGATSRLVSGFPRTPVLGVRVAAEEAAAEGSAGPPRLVPARDSGGFLIYERDPGGLDNLNSAREPFFARLDARLTYLPGGEQGRWLVYLEMINVLGRHNALAIESVIVGNPGEERPRIEEERVPSVRFMPSFGVRFRF
jgi:hypothetical protein